MSLLWALSQASDVGPIPIAPLQAQEIRPKGLGMTYADEQQMIAYERTALNYLLHSQLTGFVERLFT